MTTPTLPKTPEPSHKTTPEAAETPPPARPERPSTRRNRIEQELLAEHSRENAKGPMGYTLGDLILLTMTPEAPTFAGAPMFQLAHVTALELKALAMAAASVAEGQDAQVQSDDQLTADDVVFLVGAIGSRLDAAAELCRRLTEARWDDEGFPGHEGEDEVGITNSNPPAEPEDVAPESAEGSDTVTVLADGEQPEEPATESAARSVEVTAPSQPAESQKTEPAPAPWGGEVDERAFIIRTIGDNLLKASDLISEQIANAQSNQATDSVAMLADASLEIWKARWELGMTPSSAEVSP